jgi:hypothetical protein
MKILFLLLIMPIICLAQREVRLDNLNITIPKPDNYEDITGKLTKEEREQDHTNGLTTISKYISPKKNLTITVKMFTQYTGKMSQAEWNTVFASFKMDTEKAITDVSTQLKSLNTGFKVLPVLQETESLITYPTLFTNSEGSFIGTMSLVYNKEHIFCVYLMYPMQSEASIGHVCDWTKKYLQLFSK